MQDHQRQPQTGGHLSDLNGLSRPNIAKIIVAIISQLKVGPMTTTTRRSFSCNMLLVAFDPSCNKFQEEEDEDRDRIAT